MINFFMYIFVNYKCPSLITKVFTIEKSNDMLYLSPLLSEIRLNKCFRILFIINTFYVSILIVSESNSLSGSTKG